MRIACLHTAASNIGIFEQAASRLALPAGQLHHVVQSSLLEEAEKQGGITPAISSQTLRIITELLEDADAVLVTCSTLGTIADAAQSSFNKPVLRTDRALAEQALESGLSVTVLCTAPTTLQPTTDLFRQVFANVSVTPDIRLIDKAWDIFRSGDSATYNRMIADAAETACQKSTQLVVLAQTSMADAAALISPERKVLDAPTAALLRITAEV
ncbi:aspartate/glutamate racemase family protein [Bacillus subtilis]|uniref:aspartate/glutamate racemase family protein n=1 Tax=Pseudochrobactrum asaccharolyticum TaxID=354351 RepID=UPI001F29E4F7|nr:aspartate/glutamate racemase family protein [Pseudochrobactrum asaccharolyticum]MCF7644341.1 aspartate/glutamate racemase family protein [Pseudochrobactrum asaccharolyticum]MCF7670420.1 aspartate/glutamate racemase family protein [Bacillus subtilis]